MAYCVHDVVVASAATSQGMVRGLSVCWLACCFGDRIHQLIPANLSLHAVGQGALGIECRTEDPEILAVLQVLQHQPTAYRCYAERSFLRTLEGGCQVPIGVNTTIDGDNLTLTGMVSSLDGKRLVTDTITGLAVNAEQIGQDLANLLRTQGAQEILDEIFELVERDGLKKVLDEQTN